MIQRIEKARRARGQVGFTLIELLVVITILGVLSAVVVFAVSGIRDRGSGSAQEIDARILRTAEEAYFAKYGTYAPMSGTSPSGTPPSLTETGFLKSASTYHNISPTGPLGAPWSTPPNIWPATTSGGGTIPAGGTLVVAGGGISGVLNPATTSNGGVHANSEFMFNGLVGWGTDNLPYPELAAALPTTGNIAGTTCDGVQRCWFAEFTLRSGMVWQDSGTTYGGYNPTAAIQPITAEDVKFSFEQALLRYHGRTAASMGPALGVVVGATGNQTTVPAGAITLPDGSSGLKVRFNFLYPYSPLLKQMNVTEAPIIPRHVYLHCSVEAMGTSATLGNQTGTLCDSNTITGNSDTTLPVGSGPFLFGSTDVTTFAEYVRNNRYFRAPQPYLDKVKFLFSGTYTNLLAARTTSGSVDVASVPAANLSSFQNPDYALVVPPRGGGGGNCITTLYFNLWPRSMSAGTIQAKAVDAPYEHPIFKTFAVRKAISQAFDRATGFTQVEDPQNIGRLADSPFHKNLTEAYAAQTLPSFNVTQARADLEAAGWRDPSGGTDFTQTRVSQGVPGVADGTPLSFDVLHFSGPTNNQQLYTTRLISDLRQVGVNVVDNPQATAATQTALGLRQYDAAWFNHCHGDDPVVGVRRAYASDQIQALPFVNVAGYRSSAHDALWASATQATDPTAYANFYNQIQQQIVADLPGVWTGETLGYRGTRAVCGGFNHNNTGLFLEGAYCGP